MQIESIRHKALRRFAETGDARGLIEPTRIANMLLFIEAAASVEELAIPPNFGFHPLTGDRGGTFAITVTRNWRMTFQLVDETTITVLDLEDYH